MPSGKNLGQIQCPHCGKESFLLEEPRFEGFKKVGITRNCSTCGHVFEDNEEIPFVKAGQALPNLFEDVEREKMPNLLGDAKELRFCIYCEEYIENPFTQRCMKHKKEVAATDTCPDFRRKREA